MKALKPPPLADIWGDTVNLRSMSVAIVIGVALGSGAFIGASKLFTYLLTGIEPGLIKAYSLLAGIVGCLLSAIICANIFRPKRAVNEEDFSAEDRARVLRELHIDLEKEALELATVPPAIIEEMKQLHIYGLFASAGAPQNEEAK